MLPAVRRTLLDRKPLIDWPPRGRGTHSRSGSAYRYTQAGVLVADAGERFDHWVTDNTGIARQTCLLELASTNKVRNPGAEGAVVGAPGTMPTNWAVQYVNQGTVASEVLAFGTHPTLGIPYIQLRIAGTPSSAGDGFFVRFEANNYAVAAQNEVWASSFYVSLDAGSLSQITMRNRITERSAAGAFITQGQSTFTPTASMGRYSHARTLTDATTERVDNLLVGTFGGGAIDLTITICAPQLEKQPVATSVILPPAGTPGDSTRAVDIATLPFPSEIREMSGMVEFVEGGTVSMSFNTRLAHIGGAVPAITIRHANGSNKYQITAFNAAGTERGAVPAVGPSRGDHVRLWWWIQKDSGNLFVHVRQSINGGAFSAPVSSTALTIDMAAWSEAVYYINSRNSAIEAGVNNHIRHRVYPGYVPAEAF